MALSLIKTYSTNRPALTYDGTKLVAMEIPAPYADREIITSSSGGPGVVLATTSDSVMISTASTSALQSIYTTVEFFMLYEGTTALTLTLTWGADLYGPNLATSTCQPKVDGVTVESIQLGNPDPDTDTFDQPYYRYRLKVFLIATINGTGDINEQWAKITIS